MILTDNQKTRIANKHRSEKIKLEAALIAILRRLFKKIAKKLVDAYRNGQTLSAFEFQDEFIKALEYQYDRINKRVNTSYINASKLDNIELINTSSFTDFKRLLSVVIASRITAILRTTQKDINDAISELIESERLGSVDSLRSIFINKSAYRANLIAITETNNAFESKKKVLADGYLTHDNHLLTKTWITILDGRERPWHADAFGQTVANNDLFTVNNEKLYYPGDTSHGATPSNICNCRCSAVYTDGRIIAASRVAA